MTIDTRTSCLHQKTKMKANDCKKNCQRCGICCICRRIIDFDLDFYKPAFFLCPHLEYINNITQCKVYGTNQMPRQCQDNMWVRIKDSCLSAYRHRQGMQHLLWAKEQGYLDRLQIIDDINTKNYSSLAFVVQTFVVPYLKNVPNTMAASEDWFLKWGLSDYFSNLPVALETSFLQMVVKTCRKIKKQASTETLTLLDNLNRPIIQWLKKLKDSMWSKKNEQ